MRFFMKYCYIYFNGKNTDHGTLESKMPDVIEKFNQEMKRKSAKWGKLSSLPEGSTVHRYKEPNATVIGTFTDTAKVITEKGSRYVAIWTDGVSLEQGKNKTRLLSDDVELAQFRLKKDETYRVTVERLKKE
jgi:hypothetical protein